MRLNLWAYISALLALVVIRVVVVVVQMPVVLVAAVGAVVIVIVEVHVVVAAAVVVVAVIVVLVEVYVAISNTKTNPFDLLLPVSSRDYDPEENRLQNGVGTYTPPKTLGKTKWRYLDCSVWNKPRHQFLFTGNLQV